MLWAFSSGSRTSASIPRATLSLVISLTLVPLSYYEHTKTLRPSTIVAAFLSFTLLFDVVTTRTLWLRGTTLPLSSVFTTGLVVKAVLLILEARPKEPIESRAIGLEEKSGIYNRSLFWWLKPLFLKGYRSNLRLEDLTKLEDEFSSKTLCRSIEQAWRKPRSKYYETFSTLEESND